jgi:hypothetical protein
MDELLGRSKNFWLLVVAIFLILFLVSFLVLPKLFVFLVTQSEVNHFSEVDYHSSLQFTLSEDGKMEEIEVMFSDILIKKDYKKINVVITDIPQKNQITWIDENGQVVNHLGYDVFPEGDSLSVYLYNNTAAFSHQGWDVEKIAKENEILLIKALMYHRGWPIEKINEEAKKIFVSLHDQYPNPLFLMTYDF